MLVLCCLSRYLCWCCFFYLGICAGVVLSILVFVFYLCYFVCPESFTSVVLSIQMVYCVVSIRMVSCVVLSIKIVLLVFLLFIQVFQWCCLCYPISFTISFVFPCICVFLPIQVLSTGVVFSIQVFFAGVFFVYPGILCCVVFSIQVFVAGVYFCLSMYSLLVLFCLSMYSLLVLFFLSRYSLLVFFCVYPCILCWCCFVYPGNFFYTGVALSF